MSFTNLKYHIVFSTKERRGLLTDDIRPRIVQYIGGVARAGKSTLFEGGGVKDHLHLAVSVHPTVAISDFVREVKSKSSGWLRQEMGFGRFRWQDEYAAFTVSQSQWTSVLKYIRTQKTHHHGMSFEDELRALLMKHGIEFDACHLLR